VIENRPRVDAGPTAVQSTAVKDQEKALKEACAQFESLFIHQLFKGMRKTVAESKLIHGGNSEKIWEDMRDQALSEELAKGEGLGLARLLYEQLTQENGTGPAAHRNRALESYLKVGKAQAGVEPAGEAGELSLPVDGRISSGFGLRVHPILGTERMHHGLDLAAPEGTSVRAAAPGRVVFSGREEGYGWLVEIDHGQGLRTRYGHNQENLVAAGDLVAAGEVVAKVGSTGLSTGPHLHFEVRREGRPVDPLTAVGQGEIRSAGLKSKPSDKSDA